MRGTVLVLGCIGIVLGVALVACGGAKVSASATPAPVRPAAPSSSSAPDAAVVPPGAIRRSAVRRALAAGPGAFLQRVELEDEPVFAKGRFHGFRIAKLRGDGWEGIDLHPGDVVTRVNGKSVERPQDAFEVFHGLEVAREIRVDYERDGAPRAVAYPIVDD